MKPTYSSAVKAPVVLALRKEAKPSSQLAAAYNVHPRGLRDWRTRAVKNQSARFDKHDDAARLRAAHAPQREDRYA